MALRLLISREGFVLVVAYERASRNTRVQRQVETLARLIAFQTPEAVKHLPSPSHDPDQLLQAMADALAEVWRERGVDPASAAWNAGLTRADVRKLFPTNGSNSC